MACSFGTGRNPAATTAAIRSQSSRLDAWTWKVAIAWARPMPASSSTAGKARQRMVRRNDMPERSNEIERYAGRGSDRPRCVIQLLMIAF